MIKCDLCKSDVPETWNGRCGACEVLYNKASRCDELEKKNTELQANNKRLREALEFCSTQDLFEENSDGSLEYRYSEWFGDVAAEAINETPPQSLAVVKAETIRKVVTKWSYPYEGTPTCDSDDLLREANEIEAEAKDND